MKFQEDIINWLLEDNNPPVKYLTLKNLLLKKDTDPEVIKAKSNLMEYTVTKNILKHSDDFLKHDDKAYWKYKGKYWQIIFLGQFLADGNDKRIKKGVEQILKKIQSDSKKWWMCLTANLLTALMKLGYKNNSIVIEETENLAKRFIDEKGINCDGINYSLLNQCYMALPKLLLCFAEINIDKRSLSVKKAIKLITKTLIEKEVYIYVPENRKQWQNILTNQPHRSELPKGSTVKAWVLKQKKEFLNSKGLGSRDSKKGWLKFGFPLNYNSDILEAMYALAKAGSSMNKKLQDPLDIIVQKMNKGGKWILENSLNGKMLEDVEEKGEPSKWLTYYSLFILNNFSV
jgi:hypothetical protein